MMPGMVSPITLLARRHQSTLLIYSTYTEPMSATGFMLSTTNWSAVV